MNKASLEQYEKIRIVEDATIINLNTAYATPLNGTYLSNVNFTTNGLIIPHVLTDRVEIQVLNIQLPISFYVINNANNIVNYTIAGVQYTITLALGNYDYVGFAAEMTTKFSAKATPITIAFDTQTGVMIFTYTSDFSFLDTSTCKYVIGFNNTVTSISNVLTMSYPLNLLGPKKIKIFSNSLPTSNYDSAGGSCLISFSQNTPMFDLLTYENATGHKNILRTSIVNNIDFLLTDEYNEPLDFNNNNWDITIRLAVFRYYMPSLSTFNQILNDQKFNLNEENDEYTLEPSVQALT